jgi:hypothetical protein
MRKWGKKTNYIENRRNSARLKEERDKYEAHFASIDRIANALESTQDQEQTDDDKRAVREKLTIGLLIATVIFTALADLIFYWTLKDSHENATQQLTKIDTQLGLMKSGSQQTDTQIAVNKDLASAAKDQATAAHESGNAVRENTILSGRAWIGPSIVTINPTPVAGTPVTISIGFQNSGRVPATDLGVFIDDFFVTADEDKNGVSRARLDKNVGDCKARVPVNGAQVVYPSAGGVGQEMSSELDKSMVDEQFVSGGKILFVSGCFVYTTFNAPHHSAFCFYYRAGQTKPPSLSLCIDGGYAD